RRGARLFRRGSILIPFQPEETTMDDKLADNVPLSAIGSATVWDATEHKHGGFAIGHRTVETLNALRATDHAVGPAYTIRLRRAATSDPANREKFLAAYDR